MRFKTKRLLVRTKMNQISDLCNLIQQSSGTVPVMNSQPYPKNDDHVLHRLDNLITIYTDILKNGIDVQ